MRIISGTARGTKLFTLSGNDITRPTLDRVKEALFSSIQVQILDANVLDLFAGSGALGLEALSRGARKAVFCDHSKEAIEIIKQNIIKTHMTEQAEVVMSDYKELLTKTQEEYDIIFLDSPYASDYDIEALKRLILEEKTSEKNEDLRDERQEEDTCKRWNYYSGNRFRKKNRRYK